MKDLGFEKRTKNEEYMNKDEDRFCLHSGRSQCLKRPPNHSAWRPQQVDFTNDIVTYCLLIEFTKDGHSLHYPHT